ncbi:MAG: EF-P lysine aminoacylase EpmA [Haliea sp.]
MNEDWRPTALLAVLRARAAMLARVRAFFATRGVLEVETPQVSRAAPTDPALDSLGVATNGAPRFLQTSPEFPMKRLLCAGSGDVYQIARVFRAGEAGRFHNPEFTLLEWYRPGMDQHQLMAEVAALVCACLGERPWQALSYRELFQRSIGVDPFADSLASLQRAARERVDVGDLSGDRDLWLDLLLTHCIEPWLAQQGLCFVYDYPPSQAALARLGERDGYAVGERFELYVDGIELANGYHELADAAEQRARFEEDNRRRHARGQEQRPLDELLLAALAVGLPDCSGVALGVDRLLLLATGEADIRRLLAFSWDRS